MSGDKKAYIIGICGSGMASLAGLLIEDGFNVEGSDVNFYPPFSTLLENLKGVKLKRGFKKENVPEEVHLPVVGNVVKRDNVEVRILRERSAKLYSLPTAVNEVFAKNRLGVVVAGTHGKTTTTSLAGWTFFKSRLNPTYLAGGISRNTKKSYLLGSGKVLIVEGDEYSSSPFDSRPKMLVYKNDLGIVTSVEQDHLDIYKDFDEYCSVFQEFIKGCSAVILNADDPNVRKVYGGEKTEDCITFGLEKGDLRAEKVSFKEGWTNFEVILNSNSQGNFRIQLPGYHNVMNALAVISLAVVLGVPLEELKEGLESFEGVMRRQEIIWSGGGILIVDDFAHHPTAIKETIRAIRTKFPESRIWAVFEPRSFSMRTNVMEEALFHSLKMADVVVLSKPFRDPSPPFKPLDGKSLSLRLKNEMKISEYFETPEDISEFILRESKNGDVIVLMSSGDFGGLKNLLLEEIEKK